VTAAGALPLVSVVIVPTGFNAALRVARGDVIVRVVATEVCLVEARVPAGSRE
jgi:hypothetical protein